jgi:thiol-disulfide isomerase/thioredoxin
MLGFSNKKEGRAKRGQSVKSSYFRHMKHIISLFLLFSISTTSWAIDYKDSLPLSQISQIKEHIEFIQQNPDSINSLNYLYFYRIDLPLKKLDELYSKMSERLKSTSKGKSLRTDIQWRHNIMKKISDYTLLDVNDKKVQLSEFLKSKKYTLIDFWGSWCIPCRNDAPFLIELNNKYSNSNFGFISISEDVNKKDWLEAIRIDKTNKWTQLIDSKRNIQNDLGIETIPRKILVNEKLEVIGVYTANTYGKYNLMSELKKLATAP